MTKHQLFIESVKTILIILNLWLILLPLWIWVGIDYPNTEHPLLYIGLGFIPLGINLALLTTYPMMRKIADRDSHVCD